jgi:sulfide:quinone oxidoreductase
MLHVSPPQKAPAFIASSPFANAAGWVDVDQATLQQTKYSNVFSLGDACSAPNAKTAAAARKQAPIVAENILAQLAGKPLPCHYDGYGSCPLTVEQGKIVLAEFGFGGKLLPSFPSAVIDGKKPSRLAWLLKKDLLPFIYWNGMLKGREWMARPKMDA